MRVSPPAAERPACRGDRRGAAGPARDSPAAGRRGARRELGGRGGRARLLRRAVAAVLELDRRVGRAHRRGIVRREDDRDPARREAPHRLEHGGARLGVELRGRLIGDDEARTRDGNLRKRGALLLPAGELLRQTAAAPREPEPGEDGLRLPAAGARSLGASA